MISILQGLLCALLLISAAPLPAAAPSASSMKTVIRLYRDFSWEAAFDFTDAHARPFQSQSREVLARYLTPKLVSLLLRDRKSAGKAGTVGSLDFSPLWDAQDPVGANVQIRQESPDRVVVLLSYCQEAAHRELTYHLLRTKQGWRIADIGYGPQRPSLVDLLSAAP